MRLTLHRGVGYTYITRTSHTRQSSVPASKNCIRSSPHAAPEGVAGHCPHRQGNLRAAARHAPARLRAQGARRNPRLRSLGRSRNQVHGQRLRRAGSWESQFPRSFRGRPGSGTPRLWRRFRSQAASGGGGAPRGTRARLPGKRGGVRGARAAGRQWRRRWRKAAATRRRCSPSNPLRRPPEARRRSRAARSGGMPGTRTKSRSCMKRTNSLRMNWRCSWNDWGRRTRPCTDQPWRNCGNRFVLLQLS